MTGELAANSDLDFFVSKHSRDLQFAAAERLYIFSEG